MITLNRETCGYRRNERDGKAEKYVQVTEFDINPECIQTLHDFKEDNPEFYKVRNKTRIATVGGVYFLCKETRAEIKRKIYWHTLWRYDPRCSTLARQTGMMEDETKTS